MGPYPHLLPLTVNASPSYKHGFKLIEVRNTEYATLIPLFLLLFSFLRANSGIGVPSAHGSQGL